MPTPTRPYWTIVVTSNADDGTLAVSAHGHFRDLDRASERRVKLETALARTAPGRCQVDIVRIAPPTFSAAFALHVMDSA